MKNRTNYTNAKARLKDIADVAKIAYPNDKPKIRESINAYGYTLESIFN